MSNPVSVSIGLQTQKGIIYGQETWYSVEYLALEQNESNKIAYSLA